ncbi:hypothetical protein TrVFT333_011630 [Trichoderma virens FT-333]|nr:hypothetical protein TrVFT333_011630 [Trichoderma virens FT-333]
MDESTWKCVRCDTDFDSQEDLRLHILSSERHFACMECMEAGEWQDFLTRRALKSHIWGKHRQGAKQGVEKPNNTKRNTKEENTVPTGVRDTPLDGFFTSFAGFAYDPHRSPEASWKTLRKFKAWRNGPGLRSPEEDDAWAQYQRALVREVEMWFGDETDLTAWRTLCKAVGKVDPPYDIRKCKGILRNTHVNIVDLIAWGRNGGDENDGEKVRVFKSVEELSKYTVKYKKVFTKQELMQYNGGNVVLKHLLRVIFSKGRRWML